MAIVALVLWAVTAAAGISLLSTGGTARRAAASVARVAGIPASTRPASTGPQADAGGEPAPVITRAQTAHAIATARSRALPLTAEGKPPPVPRVTVGTPPGEHPLLEFCHPALAVTGLACWFMFVFVKYRPMAWISLGILVVAISLGLAWLARNRQALRQHATAAWRFPRGLVLAHGLAAAVAITLTVLTALTASRG